MEFEDAARYLSKNGWLSTLPESLRKAWLSGSKILKVTKGENVLYVHDDPHFVVGIAEGSFGAVFNSDGAQTRLVTIYGPGNWFGDAAVLTDHERRGTALARQDCTCLVVPSEHVHAVAARSPEIWRWMATNVMFQFDSIFLLTEAALNRDPTRRIVLMILSLCQLNPTLHTFDVSNDEIGQMVGLTRNTVAKCLRVLEARGLIERKYAQLIVKSKSALRAELSRHSAS